MPLLTKQVISNYLRSDCRRRLRLDLTPDTQNYQAERQAAGMPPRHVGRPGLQALAAAGVEWEQLKLNDLVQIFGIAALIGASTRTPTGSYTFDPSPLSALLPQAHPGRFLIQGQFRIGPSFEGALGISALRASWSLNYGDLRPDFIQVFASGAFAKEVLPDGNVLDLPQGDARLALRVTDIKLTAEPSVPYFIEVTYYSMALAGWLRDQGLDHQFFVVPLPAIWPGSHEASTMVRLQAESRAQGQTLTYADLLSALDSDLEVAEFGVFAPRLRRFFQNEVDTILSTPWRQLEWHVDNRCIGCEYLGYPWPGTQSHPDHCWPMASTQDHLSRVAFVSRGARGALEDHQISSVATLAGTHPTNAAYDSHHVLRATRTVVAGRAQVLATGQSVLPPQVGTSAIMPAWADLRLYLTADFDVGSGVTVAFGFKAIWAVGRQRVQPGQQHFRPFNARVLPIDQRSLQVEQRELFNLLNAIDQAMRFAHATLNDATVQIYVWDSLTYEHLVRVIGRHLAAIIQNQQLRRLAWLFPPDTLVANPDLSDRMCPVTVVRDVIRAVVAAPVPHYYSLLTVAREYHSAHTQAPYNLFQVPVFFEDPLSDQIPSERAHEIWSRAGGPRPWNVQLQQLERTVMVKLSAIESVAQRLGEDLQGQLDRTAPRISHLRPPTLPQRMSDDARLWFVFARLNVALEELEVQTLHAMPPHEREARFKSARLVQRLSGPAEQQVLARHGLQSAPNLFVYELNVASREVRARERDFTFALAPANRPGFLSDKLRRIAGSLRLPLGPTQNEWTLMERVTQTTIVAIDRDSGHIVVELALAWQPVLRALEVANIVDFSQDVMLDPIYRDFLIPRLELTLNAIGNPPIAVASADPNVPPALGSARRSLRGRPSPVAEVLWNATVLQQTQIARSLGPISPLLVQGEHDLNASQWNAWTEALTHRLWLIWGPPGTGKSRTLRSIVLGALHAAQQQGAPFRILVTGPTYEAIDNIIIDVHATLTGSSPAAIPTVTVSRVRSSTKPLDPRIPSSIDVTTAASNQAYRALQVRLQQHQGCDLVGATAQQAHRLLVAAGGATAELFDMIVVDEASQLDVASSILPLAGLASNGTVVVAGDPKQLPPIHQAEPPLNLEANVGPIFSYFEDRYNLHPSVLDINYRSCRTIVELAHLADYPHSLSAYSPDLQLDLTSPIPNGLTPPPNWPAELFWTPEWSRLLDPEQRVVCFVYREGRSSQWNQFEADAIASLAYLLADRLCAQLLNERDAAGNPIPPSAVAYSRSEFWERGVGIVTPHRAQQALIVGRLQRIFQATSTQGIREAVDTVERFQGQQRDVMLATFALGDPDAISDEDEFLLSLNRFNVMASRARAKLIVFVSQELVDHLSADMDVLRDSALLKSFVESFCSQCRQMTLGYLRNGVPQSVDGQFRCRP